MSDTNYGSRTIYEPKRIFLLGDVHSEADKLMSVLDQITPLITSEDHIVFCGDLVDRGEDAALTIETLITLCKSSPAQVFFVEGNHDWMLRNYLITGSKAWMQYLGSTLLDLKLRWGLADTNPDTIAAALIAKGFNEVTSRTVPYYETKDVIATHAPLDRSIVQMHGGMTYQQDFADRANNLAFRHLLDRMLNEIKWQFTGESLDIPYIDKFRVCGHQAGSFSHPRIFKDRAFIDTGCGLRENGKLTCLIYPGKKSIQSKI